MLLKSSSKYLDMELWHNKLALRGNQVCRIETSSDTGRLFFATGFLVGPNVVITSYHNISEVIKNRIDPKDVILRFGYKRVGNGQTIDMGTVYHLAPKDWLIDYSPTNLPPKLDALDYALIRVEGDPGHAIIQCQGSAIMRGWIKLLAEDYHFSRGEPMLILQHPRGEPLKIAFSSDALLSVSSDDILVTYNVTTDPGSSGAPGFNVDLDLIVLHQGANNDLQANQGVNMYAILQALTAKSLQGLVSKEVPVTEDEFSKESVGSHRQFASDPAVLAVIAGGENPTTEFKIGAIRNPHNGQKDKSMESGVIEAVAGFMNSFDGGKLLIGVKNDKTIEGINEEYKFASKQRADWDSYELFLRQILDAHLSIKNPGLLYAIMLYQVEGKDICSIRVPPAPEPVYVDKKFFFVRMGNRTLSLEGPEHADYILKRWSFKQGQEL